MGGRRIERGRALKEISKWTNQSRLRVSQELSSPRPQPLKPHSGAPCFEFPKFTPEISEISAATLPTPSLPTTLKSSARQVLLAVGSEVLSILIQKVPENVGPPPRRAQTLS